MVKRLGILQRICYKRGKEFGSDRIGYKFKLQHLTVLTSGSILDIPSNIGTDGLKEGYR